MQTANNAQAADAAKKMLEPGCYFDSHHGQYIGKMVQELATEYGWTGEAILDPYEEDYCEAWIEAEQYLATNHTPDGYWFGSTEDNNDWGVWENEPEEDTDPIEATHTLDTSWLNGNYTLQSGTEAVINTSLPYVAIGDYFWQGQEADEVIEAIHQIWTTGTEGMTEAEAVEVWASNNLEL